MGESLGLGAGGLASGMGLPGSTQIPGAAITPAQLAALRQPPATAPGMPTLATPTPGGGFGAGLGGAGLGGGGLGGGMGTGLGQAQLAQLLSQPGALQALLAARGQGAS